MTGQRAGCTVVQMECRKEQHIDTALVLSILACCTAVHTMNKLCCLAVEVGRGVHPCAAAVMRIPCYVRHLLRFASLECSAASQLQDTVTCWPCKRALQATYQYCPALCMGSFLLGSAHVSVSPTVVFFAATVNMVATFCILASKQRGLASNRHVFCLSADSTHRFYRPA